MPPLAKVPARRSLSASMADFPKATQEPLAEVAHDARNVLAALRLYCDLLAEPGVLASGHQHVAAELRAVASASSGLVERLAALRSAARRPQARRPRVVDSSDPSPLLESATAPQWASLPYIDDLSAAVRGLSGPLAALAGANIDLHVECLPCPGRLRLSQEELTRILINLTRNASEAMPQGGRIRITVQQGAGGNFLDAQTKSPHPRTALLCVQDNGPGIPADRMQRLFEAGFSTKKREASWPSSSHRGLGLSIVRGLAESAGGSVRAISASGRGARFEVELPLVYRTRANSGFVADLPEREHVEC
jgi:signal transduction histidine kinase